MLARAFLALPILGALVALTPNFGDPWNGLISIAYIVVLARWVRAAATPAR
jgi:ABC-type dipeptide/oligopeptide/nickel transport system permease subunit